MIGVRCAKSKSLVVVLAVAGVLAVAFGVIPAYAESVSPWWGVSSTATPTDLQPGATGEIVVLAENLGDGEADGARETVQIRDTLPSGLRARAVEEIPLGEHFEKGSSLAHCSHASERPLACTYAGVIGPYEVIEVRISVEVSLGASSGEENEVSVSGGGAPASKTVTRPIQVGGESQFGVQENVLVPEEVGGAVDTQAGSHPFQLTSVVAFNQTGEGEEAHTVGLPKDVGVLAPPGLVGNPTPLTQCTAQQFYATENSLCPAASIVGVATITFNEPKNSGIHTGPVPVYNMVPNVGEPAEFEFRVLEVAATLNTSVRTGSDYGVTVSSHNTTQTVALMSARVTLWGVPGDPRHNGQRGSECLLHPGTCAAGSETSESAPPPFLSLPTSCTGPLQSSVQVDSWAQPNEVLSFSLSEPMVSLAGCNHLPFAPEIGVVPDVPAASTPTGLTVDVHVPQAAELNPEGLAESTLRDTTVTLPVGVMLNPAGANGLEACSEAQVGFEGFKELNPSVEPGVQTAQFAAGEPSCPAASKIATVKIKTPLLPNPLEGEVYLAAQDANPFGSLVAQYLVARDPVSGVLVKLPGEVSLNPVTGQVTATFQNTPQLPFEGLELHFFGGERAPLSTPAHCGTYTTDALFAPWSGSEAVSSQPSFQITSGPDGGPCPGASLPFAPSLEGGTTNIQAGAFSALNTTLGREDGNQNLRAVTLHMPSGFTGLLSGVKLCGEPQANAGTCGPESLIGHTTVSVGLGSDPYSVTGGEVFVTGPYDGQGACTVAPSREGSSSSGCAPFGLSIVNPAVAGPYNLGKVVVRAKIEVDPYTAALTITTNESGPYAIPTMLDGIPLQIKHVLVRIDRPNFTINPTSCDAMAITGSMSSAEGASAPLDVPFQVANCANLKFAPKFGVSTSGKTSKADGASLTAKLSEPNTPQGTEANIAKVKVDLPKKLPSRLTTLQKACTNAQFEANPAACPAASKIGYATVTTPLLPVPLSGPAIFVSHGDEAFPSLTMVLQGYGVAVDLVGTTFISKAGVTSTTFKAVPDTPFDTFELTLPEGPYSALAANVPTSAKYSLCGQKLSMPTVFVAQNGAEIHETTPIDVTGCAKTKALTRAQKLRQALKACHKKQKIRRAGCERAARRKYGPVNKKKGKR